MITKGMDNIIYVGRLVFLNLVADSDHDTWKYDTRYNPSDWACASCEHKSHGNKHQMTYLTNASLF